MAIPGRVVWVQVLAVAPGECVAHFVWRKWVRERGKECEWP